MANNMFSFSASQLNEGMVSVFGCACYENVGITRKTYQLCQLVDTNYWDMWEEKVNKCQLSYYGFDTVDDFKDVYARAHLYNLLKYSSHKTVNETMNFYAKKVKRFYQREVDCNVLNILDFLKSFSLEELFCVGW